MSKPTNAAIVDSKGRRWNPFETTGTTGYVTYSEADGEIHVPYGTDEVSIMIQAHELSHVRYTAKVWPNVASGLKRLRELAGTTNAIVGYAEDMRITALAGRLGIKTLPTFGNAADEKQITDWIKSFIAAGVPEDRVRKAINFILTEHTSIVETIGLDLETLNVKRNAEAYIVHCAGYIHKLLSTGKGDKGDGDKGESGDGDKGDKADKGDDKAKGDKADKSRKADKAEKLDSGDETEDGDDKGDAEGDDKADGDEGEATDGDGDGETGGKADGDTADGETKDGETDEGDSRGTSDARSKASKADKAEPEIDLNTVKLPDIRESMLKSVPAPVDTDRLIQEFQHTIDTAPWIPVPSIERMPLVRRAVQARTKGRKLSETGTTLGSAYDAVSPNERRPFIAKRRGGFGGLTVLIDCSGSMHIQTKELETLLVKYPQGVVVTYSSAIHPDRAVARIIASHGRIAATEDFRDVCAGGNGCDGPMLEWLARQSGEKVWICDGVITGKGDGIVSHAPESREAWLAAKKIVRWRSLAEYLRSLR
jgi:hypothetical protein